MNALTPPTGTTPANTPGLLTPLVAHRWAWRIWMLLALVPSILSIFAVWRTASSAATTRGDHALAQIWFFGVAAYVAIILPAALFWRGRLFRNYSAGGIVPPRAYLLGMSTLWLALASVGLVAALGCLLSGTLMPNLGVGAAALLFYFTLWPTGDAMVRPFGRAEDAQLYEEPR